MSGIFDRLDLRKLILALALSGVALVLIGGLYASYRVQKVALIEGSLGANYAYASKLSSSIEDFFESAQQQLAYSSQVLAEDFHDKRLLQQEADRLKRQTDSFNSVVIVDKTGFVLATDPNIGLTGSIISSPGALQALQERVPLVSDPYVAKTGRLVIVISQPVFNAKRQYLGFVAGTIYLDQPSILNSLVGRHFYQDGSYLYIVDRHRVLLYHPHAERIGTRVKSNPLVDKAATGGSGKMEVVNSQGVSMLAGYAVAPGLRWAVVSQQPLERALAPLGTLFVQVLETTLPLAAVTALFIWWFSKVISKPLRQLAESARAMDEPESTNVIQHTNAWYFETANLKKALLSGIRLLQEKILRLDIESRTDVLTGLHNRRAFDMATQRFVEHGKLFSLVTVDIDHFKLVNDRFGHHVGDEVLKRLAALLIANFRSDDLVCRTGGEEFSILIAELDLDDVYRIAERLRMQVEATEIDPVGHITISLGIAQWPTHAKTIKELVARSDEMLYAAKNNGRNRVEMYPKPPQDSSTAAA